MFRNFKMTENSHYSQTSKFGINDLYIVAHASRNVDPKQDKSKNFDSSSKPFKNQNHLHAQVCEVIRNCNDLAVPSKPRTRLPLNMIVSKPATRKRLPENEANSLEEFYLSNIRNIKLPKPAGRKQAVNRKSLQSAYLYNRRKIDEIQGMKAKLKCPRYDPGDLALRRRLYDLQHNLSESVPFLRKEQDPSPGGRFSQLYDGCRRIKPIVMESEDPLQDEGSDVDQSAFEHILNKPETSVSSSTPTVRPTNDEFVWNPVILPVKNSFSSAKELLEYHYPPQYERNNGKEWLKSPGNCTTSSTSSGLTVAEETVRLTYYAGRCGAPRQMSRSGNCSTRSYPFETAVEECLPYSYQPDFLNYSEE